MWGLTEQLLAAVVDSLRVGNWQRTRDRRVPRPKPIERPGVEDPTVKRFGTKQYSLAEMAERQAAWAAGERKASGTVRSYTVEGR